MEIMLLLCQASYNAFSTKKITIVADRNVKMKKLLLQRHTIRSITRVYLFFFLGWWEEKGILMRLTVLRGSNKKNIVLRGRIMEYPEYKRRGGNILKRDPVPFGVARVGPPFTPK